MEPSRGKMKAGPRGDSSWISFFLARLGFEATEAGRLATCRAQVGQGKPKERGQKRSSKMEKFEDGQNKMVVSKGGMLLLYRMVAHKLVASPPQQRR